MSREEQRRDIQSLHRTGTRKPRLKSVDFWVSLALLFTWVPADAEPVNPLPRHGPKIHVWGGISSRGTTVLKTFRSPMTAAKFVNILEECLLETADVLYPDGWRLQLDKAPTHTAHQTQRWLEENNVSVLDWPANCTNRKSLGGPQATCRASKT